MARDSMITKTFTVKADPDTMRCFELMLARMYYNATWGHSSTVAMSVDGDGSDRFELDPTPTKEVRQIVVDGKRGEVEIATRENRVVSRRFHRSDCHHMAKSKA
jgi:hypothetical protein